MDVPAGVKVECADGSCGRAKYVVLDPASATVTHLVVVTPDVLAETRLVPLAYIAASTPELIRLKCTREELKALPLFSSYEYIRSDQGDAAYMPPELWMGSLAAYGPIIRLEEHRNLPEGELSIQRGARVEATDGPVGSVEELQVEPGSGRITHLVLREGHMWDRRHIVIPASEIDRIEQDVVVLRTNKARVNAFALLRSGSKEVEMTNNSGARAVGKEVDSRDGSRPIRDLVTDLGNADRETREKARRTLVEIGAPAVDALSTALSSGNAQVRWEAAKALQQIADPAIAPALIMALEDEDEGVRWIAAEGLSTLDKAGVVPLLKVLTTRADSAWLRNGAHHVLSRITDASLLETTAPVRAALKDVVPDVEVPVAAHNALVALEH